MPEFFDLDQPIGRLSYFLRGIVIVLWFEGLKLISFGVSYSIPVANVIVFIVWIILLCYLMVCTTIKRARDLWWSGYFVGGTLALFLLVALFTILIPDYQTHPIFTYLDIAYVGIRWIAGLQGFYLLFFETKPY